MAAESTIRTEYDALAAESPNALLVPVIERIEHDLQLLRVLAELPLRKGE